MGFLVNSTFALAQRVYDNAIGSNEWRQNANWSDGNFVNTDSRVIFQAGGNITIGGSNADSGGNVRCSQMVFPDAGGVISYTFSGSQITLNGKFGTPSIKLDKVGQSVTFNNPFVWNGLGAAVTTEREWKFIKKQSSLTFNNTLKLQSTDAFFRVTANNINSGNNINQTQFNLNHSLIGAGTIIFGNKSRPVFGPDYTGVNFNGIIEISGGAGVNGVILTSNVANPKTFLRSGGLINVTAQGASIIINGANTYKGNITHPAVAESFNLNYTDPLKLL